MDKETRDMRERVCRKRGKHGERGGRQVDGKCIEWALFGS